MAGSNDFVLSNPDETVQGQQACRDIQHRPRGLLRRTGVHDSDTAVMTSECERIAARREANSLDPASRVIQEFTTDSVEGETLSPGTRLRASVNTLDKARKDPCVGVGGSRSKKHRIRVPGQRGDSASNGFLQVL